MSLSTQSLPPDEQSRFFSASLSTSLYHTHTQTTTEIKKVLLALNLWKHYRITLIFNTAWSTLGDVSTGHGMT